MSIYLWTMIAVFTLSVFGQACILFTQSRERDLALVPFDLMLSVGMLVWTARMLP